MSHQAEADRVLRSLGRACLDHDPDVLRSVLDRVGDKWSVQVVVQMGEGPKRFNELRRSVTGISQRMLTLTLRSLERDGLVTRTVYPTIPPRVDYQLTGLGCSLLKTVRGLGEWAIANRDEILEARRRFDGDGDAESEASRQRPDAA